MTNIPQYLQNAIEAELEQVRWQEVTEAREELTDRYRQQAKSKGPLMTTEAHRLSYLATRLPATYTVCEAVFQRLSHYSIRSLLDLGAGPGTAMWAASEIFPDLNEVTLVENDIPLIEIGKKMALKSPHQSLLNAKWKTANLEQIPVFLPHDLVTMSYSVGELSSASIELLVEQAWKMTQQLLVIIEPGTPVSFERIRFIRKQLIDLGGFMVAPCPHTLPCPMADGDWCHFSARVERSFIHRRLKKATMGFEDEKYSYVVFSKNPATLPPSRIVRHPMKHSGHVNLTLCTPEGLKQETVSKKRGELYKLAKKAEWGDPFF